LCCLPLLFLAASAAAEPIVLSDETVEGILAVDESNLYLQAPAPKRLHVYRLLALPKKGGPARELVGNIEAEGIEAAADGNDVFYSANGDQDRPLFRVSRQGGTPTEIAPAHMYLDPTVGGDWIFFRDLEGLEKIPRRGGAISFVQGDVEGYALARGQVWVGLHTRGTGELMLWKTGIQGGSGEQLNLRPAERARHGFYADGDAIYWSNGDTVFRAEARKNGAVRELYRGPKNELLRLAGIDEKSLFIGLNRNFQQRLLRLPKSGGTPTQVSADGWTPFADKSGLYFVEGRKGGARVVKSQ
jgi:hypothetical protein